MKHDAIEEIELESNLTIPPPLDPHIASVSIRTGANNPTDYFDLLLSASFGEEYVTLESGHDTFEVKLTIKKAEIKIDSNNCDLHLLPNGQEEAWKGTEERNRQKKSGMNVSGNSKAKLTTLGLDADVTLGAEASRSSASQNNSVVEREVLPWRQMTEDTIQVGYLDEPTRPLQGRILDENVSLRVTPTDLSERIGVLARVRVRERWIDISDVSPISVSQKFGKFLKTISGADPEALRRRELFSKLLGHLVAMRLQSSADTRDATLAAAAIVFTPKTDSFSGHKMPAPRGGVKVDPTAIESFIQSSGDELKVLSELGVDLGDTQEADDEETFDNIWPINTGFQFVNDFETLHLEKWFSLSFGRKVKIVDQWELESVGLHTFRLEITGEEHEKADAAQILKMIGWTGEGTTIAAEIGILAKGEQAFRFAKLCGFKYGYGAFQRRLTPFREFRGNAYVMAFHRVMELSSGDFDPDRITGSTLNVELYSMANEQLEF